MTLFLEAVNIFLLLIIVAWIVIACKLQVSFKDKLLAVASGCWAVAALHRGGQWLVSYFIDDKSHPLLGAIDVGANYIVEYEVLISARSFNLFMMFVCILFCMLFLSLYGKDRQAN